VKLAPAQPEEALLLEPGEYLLVLSWLQGRTARGGKRYLRCGFDVISGPASGRSFVATMGVDLLQRGTRGRWQVWMEQCGVRDLVDLDDDSAILRAFRGRPFKARVKVDEPTAERGAVNDLDVFVYPRRYSDQDRAEIQRWREEHAR